MFESIRSYFRLNRLAKAIYEAQQNQYPTFVQAAQACHKLIRKTRKDYSIVKHQQDEVYWVVRAKSAKALAQEGHTIL
ncbi:hypothetical protein [Larkinella arboricola]|uniref:Uncharacterized protein n=1 Tax=Larkinella arboricola TaxID=643671 RepID=A0A327WPQ7_LARAB|nr:hypothetical protein [Larkinella arboricola]RAJ94348.1 hypothetical protein LX87_04235 [Larkinella arboricola]